MWIVRPTRSEANRGRDSDGEDENYRDGVTPLVRGQAVTKRASHSQTQDSAARLARETGTTGIKACSGPVRALPHRAAINKIKQEERAAHMVGGDNDIPH